jgi:hypothetical protein
LDAECCRNLKIKYPPNATGCRTSPITAALALVSIISTERLSAVSASLSPAEPETVIAAPSDQAEIDPDNLIVDGSTEPIFRLNRESFRVRSAKLPNPEFS